MARHYRWAEMTAVVFAIACGFFAYRHQSEKTSGISGETDWQPLRWYRLDSDGADVSCVLPAAFRYRLVIACLSDADEEPAVKLNLMPSTPGASDSCRRLIEIEPRALQDRETSDKASVSPVRPVEVQHPAPEKDFHLHVTEGDLTDPKQYVPIRAWSVAEGHRVRVYVDKLVANGDVSEGQVADLLRLIEEEVLPRVETQFGPLRDVDHDGRFAVLLTPWLSRLQGGRTSIGGMVRSSDFQLDVSPPLSNRCDMLFLNSSLPSGAALRDLISHEIAHAACISQRVSQAGRTFRDEDDWLSEALAHLAEPGWTNLDYRLAAFLEDPSRYPLVVPDYYRAGLWRNAGCRGATYSFLRWCVDRFGNGLVRQLARSRHRGIFNLQLATGTRFEELFRAWSLDLADGRALATSEMQHVLSRFGSNRLRQTTSICEPSQQTLRIRGSAFAVVEVGSPQMSGRVLRIVGDANAKWQFSICQVPDDSGGHTERNMIAANRR